MKILHVSNIAQNAYINSLILGQAGHDCDVLAYDLYHFACSPEWYELFDVDMPADVIQDGFFPNFYSIGQSMPVIGPNVAQGPMFNALAYLELRRRGDPLARTALSALRYLRFKCTILKTTTPFLMEWGNEAFERAVSNCDLPSELRQDILAGRAADEALAFIRSRIMKFNPRADVMGLSVPFTDDAAHPLAAVAALDQPLADYLQIMEASGLLYALGLVRPKSYPSDLSHLAKVGSPGDLAQFQVYGDLWRSVFSSYDIVIFYADSCMFAITNGISGYCALEHGTIRVIPFEDSTYGRLVTAGYMAAEKVFITNTDYVSSKKRLEFGKGQSVYLPHPFDEKAAFKFESNFHARKSEDGIVRFFCPARQDWRSRDPKMSKANDYIFHAAKALLDADVRNFHLICIAWGVDLEASKALCEELGIAAHVTWIAPLSKRQLWEAMLTYDCIIDQFLISVVSGITFEALALGRRLICRDDGVENTEFFGEAPPILSAATAGEIERRMREVIDDPDDIAGIGGRCTSWVKKYHSAQRITELQIAAFNDVLAERRTLRRTA
jgi:hypothetical protein